MVAGQTRPDPEPVRCSGEGDVLGQTQRTQVVDARDRHRRGQQPEHRAGDRTLELAQDVAAAETGFALTGDVIQAGTSRVGRQDSSEALAGLYEVMSARLEPSYGPAPAGQYS